MTFLQLHCHSSVVHCFDAAQAEEALLRHYLLHLVIREQRSMVPLYACHVQPSTRKDAYMALMHLLSDQPIGEHLEVFEESHQIFEDWRNSRMQDSLEEEAMQSLAEQVCCAPPSTLPMRICGARLCSIPASKAFLSQPEACRFCISASWVIPLLENAGHGFVLWACSHGALIAG